MLFLTKYWQSWSTDQDHDRQITFWSDRWSLFTIFLDHDLDLIVDRFFTDLDRILRSLFSRSLNSGKDCQFQKIQLFRVMFFINLRSVCCRHHQIALYGLTLLFSAKHSSKTTRARRQQHLNFAAIIVLKLQEIREEFLWLKVETIYQMNSGIFWYVYYNLVSTSFSWTSIFE